MTHYCGSKNEHGPHMWHQIRKPIGSIFECRGKGGGRESGNPGSVGGAESTRAAAANPACPDCEDFWQIVDPVPRHVHWCHERIRELEHMEKLLEARAEEAEARVKELEEELRKAENAGLEMLHRLEHDPDEKERLG